MNKILLCGLLICLLGAAGRGYGQEVVLTVSNANNTLEGQIITFPVMLKSNGDVGGITFSLQYDEVSLGRPVFEWSSLFGLSINSVNAETPGDVEVTFAFPGQTVPSGDQLVGNLSFRVRSMPFGMETIIEPDIKDISDALGDPLEGDRNAKLGVARIDPRKVKGDNNGNGYLDVGDATLIQRLVAGMDPVRSWDLALNDLNGSGDLDSGDVVKVLRVVVGIDPQPEQNRRLAKMGGGDGDSDEKVVLSIVKMNAGVVKVRVALDDMSTNVSGASFELQFSNEVLRLQKGSTSSGGGVGGEFSFTGSVIYNTTGGVVSKESQPIWNASHRGEGTTQQVGTLAMAVTSPEPWKVKDGAVAEVTFEVQDGADMNEAVLKIKPVEVTPDGFDNRILSGLSLNLGTGETSGLGLGDNVDIEIEEVSLKKGWNLISFYVESEDMAPAMVLASIKDNLVQIKNLKNSYNPALPAFINTLKGLNVQDGYWVKVDADVSFELEGSVPEGASIPVRSGWNLVGYPRESGAAPANEFTSLGDTVLQFKNLKDSYNPALPAFINTLKVITPGLGYWLNVSEDGVWNMGD